MSGPVGEGRTTVSGPVGREGPCPSPMSRSTSNWKKCVGGGLSRGKAPLNESPASPTPYPIPMSHPSSMPRPSPMPCPMYVYVCIIYQLFSGWDGSTAPPPPPHEGLILVKSMLISGCLWSTLICPVQTSFRTSDIAIFEALAVILRCFCIRHGLCLMMQLYMSYDLNLFAKNTAENTLCIEFCHCTVDILTSLSL